MLIENEKKEHIKQANIRWRTRHPEALANWSKKHPKYMKEWKSNMKGINAGSPTIKIEMHELWSSGEKLSFTSKDVTAEYVPQNRESMLIKAPIVKRFKGGDLAVVSESDKNIYREIEETMKKESASKRG